MPISGQTPISNISTVKEQEESYQPLLLAELTFADGGVLRLSSENLDSGNSGVQWSGENWFPRLKQQSLDQISSISNNGIVQSPTVTLEISDADKEILTAWEWANDRGFKGATLRLYFVYADLIAGTFSSDSRVVFVGLSNAPQLNPTSLSITADNMLNMSKRFFPTAQCAKNCIWEFPTTVDERADGLINQFSTFYQCVYSPDQSGR